MPFQRYFKGTKIYKSDLTQTDPRDVDRVWMKHRAKCLYDDHFVVS